ncbi:MAG: DUF4430 domain-containing protein [Candidatus Aenigmarchaeota archaeon]|nr:DUF4430 domain-containing protein [Candidatus Aenigmarchaeota archaeon]
MDNLSRFWGSEDFREISFSESVMFFEIQEEMKKFNSEIKINFKEMVEEFLKKAEERKKKKGKYSEENDEEEETYENVFSQNKQSKEKIKEKYAEDTKEKKVEKNVREDEHVNYETIEKEFRRNDLEIKHIDENFANIEYRKPLESGNHKVYQQIFVESEHRHKTVYDLLKNLKNEKGVDVEITEKTFNGQKVKYIESLDGKRDALLEGEEVTYKKGTNTYWEVLINGEFADRPIDQMKIKEGDVVEFRLKTETDETSCGGSLDEYAMISMVQKGILNRSKLPSYMQLAVGNGFYDGFPSLYQGEKSGKNTFYHIMPVFGVG